MLLVCVYIPCCVLLYYVWRRITAPTDEPPVLPGALPIIGHLHHILGGPTRVAKYVQKMSMESLKLGGVSRFIVGCSTYYVLTDPADGIKAINACSEKGDVYKFGNKFFGEGLLTANDEKSRTHRKLLNPMFTQQALNSFMGVFNEQARRLLSTLDEKAASGPFECEDCVTVWSLETSCRTVMGIDVTNEKNENSEYVYALGAIMEIFLLRGLRPWLHKKYIYNWSSLSKEEDKLSRIIKRRSTQVLTERKNMLRGSVDSFRPFVDHILMLSTEKNLLSDEDVLDEIKTLIFGSYETTAQSICFTLMMLGVHTEVQDRAYKELENIFVNSDRDVDKYDLAKMVYLEAVIKETLRFRPTVPGFLKHITSDIKLSKSTLRAGRDLFVSTFGMCRHPMWGADAAQFRPERWLDAATLPDTAAAFPVFGLGKRSCIGKTYGLMSMKVTLAHILRRYIISSREDNPDMKIGLVMKPASPLIMTLEIRKQC